MINRVASVLAFVAISLSSPCIFGAERENPLEVWMTQFLRSADGAEPPISVTSKIQMESGIPGIQFRLTNISHESVHIYPHSLPWGSPDSITLFAIRADGKVLENTYRISDPGPADELEIRPGESVEGLYDVDYMVRIQPADRKQDIFLAWSYRWWNSGSKRPSSPITGAVVIPARNAASSLSPNPTP